MLLSKHLPQACGEQQAARIYMIRVCQIRQASAGMRRQLAWGRGPHLLLGTVAVGDVARHTLVGAVAGLATGGGALGAGGALGGHLAPAAGGAAVPAGDDPRLPALGLDGLTALACRRGVGAAVAAEGTGSSRWEVKRPRERRADGGSRPAAERVGGAGGSLRGGRGGGGPGLAGDDSPNEEVLEGDHGVLILVGVVGVWDTHGACGFRCAGRQSSNRANAVRQAIRAVRSWQRRPGTDAAGRAATAHLQQAAAPHSAACAPWSSPELSNRLTKSVSSVGFDSPAGGCSSAGETGRGAPVLSWVGHATLRRQSF